MKAGATARYCALLYGHDDLLLKTRGYLLSTIDCGSVAAHNLREYKQQVLTPALNLIVICQTMSLQECEAAAAFATEARITAQMLLLYARQQPCSPDGGSVIFNAASGPAAFLQTAGRMLITTGRDIQHVSLADLPAAMHLSAYLSLW